MVKKGLAIVVSVLMILQISTAFASGSYTEGFNYAADTVMNTVDGWSGSSSATVVADPVNNENGNVLFLKTGEGNINSTFDPVSSVGGVDVSYRFALGGNGDNGNSLCTGAYFRLLDGNKTIGTIGCIRISNGTFYDGATAPQYNPAVLGIMSPTAASMQTGNMNPNNIKAFQTWVRYPVVPESWYYARFQIDFTAKTFDVYVKSGSPVTDEMIADPANADLRGYALDFPFADDTAESVSAFSMGLAWASQQRTVCVDDISVASMVPDGTFDIDETTATYSVSGDTINVSANVDMPIVGPGQASVIAAAYDANNTLVGIDINFVADQEKLQDGTIQFSTQLTGGNSVASVKLYLWDSILRRNSIAPAVSCTAQ